MASDDVPWSTAAVSSAYTDDEQEITRYAPKLRMAMAAMIIRAITLSLYSQPRTVAFPPLASLISLAEVGNNLEKHAGNAIE